VNLEPTMRILSVVEATNINAVAKLVLDFHAVAREMAESHDEFPSIVCSIATFDRVSSGEQEPNDFIKAVHNAGIEIDVIPEQRRFDLRVVSALKETAARRKPDIIITNSVKSHFIMWRSRLWKKYPWVAFHHGYTNTDRKMRLYNRFDRWSLPKATAVITVCNAFARELTDVTGVPLEKLRVQHNSIRLSPPATQEDARKLRERLGISSDQQIILCIGRLSKEKAQADLIQAFKELRQTHPDLDCTLVIVGDGPERESLTAAAKASGFAECIIFTGQVADVRPYYAIANVFALPSHSEGSPNVLLEAMAARVPVVATEVGGVPEVVESETSALLVPSMQPATLAAALARVLRNADLGSKLVEAAAAEVATNHKPERYVESIVSIYEAAISSRNVIAQ
jgi:glycosyltransferase involved in cell wall biosynthesis